MEFYMFISVVNSKYIFNHFNFNDISQLGSACYASVYLCMRLPMFGILTTN